MTKRLTIALVALAMMVLVAVLPVSATNNGNYYVVANVINQGATVFIGEQNLDVSRALADSGAVGNKIGWWPSGTNPLSDPYGQFFDFGATGANSFTVGDTFVGYTGNWYGLDAAGQKTQQIFNVQDPSLTISVWDYDQNADVTGKSIPQTENLSFKVATNMIGALDKTPALKPHRQPIYNAGGNSTIGLLSDGYINIRVKDESGATLVSLLNQDGTLQSLSALNITTSPYFWTNPDGTLANWSTGALNSNGQQAYPIGTYTVYAESKLNNMKDNYLNGGVAYTTKTISQTVTVSVVSNTVKIEANKDSVVRSKTFSVTVTGKPSTFYNVWVKNVNGFALNVRDNEPPLVTKGQDQVTGGSAVTAAYLFQNGGGGINNVSSNSFGNATMGEFSYALIKTSTAGTRTVEFTTTPDTKAQKYTIRVEQQFPAGAYNTGSYKSDEVDVNVEKGAVTIVAAGDQSYYLGEEIKLSGTNTESYTTYLFIIGPNLNANGAKLTDPRTAVNINDINSFISAAVLGDNTWSYKWGTATVPLDAGTYTIYALSQPVDRDPLNIAQAAYGTVSVIIKKPFVSATASQSTVAKGDRVYITGTAEGQPSPGVAIWILGKNYAVYKTESVNADSSFKYEVKQADTRDLASGQYFVVVQHPMANNQFDIRVVDASGAGAPQGRLAGSIPYFVNNRMLGTQPQGTNVFLINGAGALQGSDAAEALVQAINDPNVDDTYTKLQFLIEQPTITIDPVGDRHVGDKFTITAKTNLAVDDEVLVQVYSSSFQPTQKSQSGEFSGATGTIKVTAGDGGLNALSFDVDASTFKPDEYIVTEDAVIQDATGTALFNVLEGPAPTAVPTTVVTTVVPTTVATPVPTTATPTPTPTQSPGYGALIALIGLGAVAFIVVRRH